MNNFTNKKIGIWGFGVVGQSALQYFDQYQLASIEILDKKPIIAPHTKNQLITCVQNPSVIHNFLELNDYILVSPGIKLHDYQQYAHKFIAELDLYQAQIATSTIAITGSLGKTSITHLLTSILNMMHIRVIAAGNIGYGMLNLLYQKLTPPDITVLELSSFQLQQAQTFAPDLAIITNLYPNHLDHHQDMQEYCTAKSNIFMQQSDSQHALLPINIIDQITQCTNIKKNWSFFSDTKPTTDQFALYDHQTIYYLDDQKVYKKTDQTIDQIFDLAILPAITFDPNWLIIIAALDIKKLDLTNLATFAQQLDIPDHRLQKIASHKGSNFYNDSKSTVWQASLQAVISLEKISPLPIKLFLGGLDKGADRTPLLAALAGKSIEIFAFGQQADQIAQLCQQFAIPCKAHATLDAAWNDCIQNVNQPAQILFSPGGASYDLFSDYQARGRYFTQLVQDFCAKN